LVISGDIKLNTEHSQMGCIAIKRGFKSGWDCAEKRNSEVKAKAFLKECPNPEHNGNSKALSVAQRRKK